MFELFKVIKVDFYDKVQTDLINVITRFVVSDCANLHFYTPDIGVWWISLGNQSSTLNILKYLGTDMGLRVIAENTDYYTHFDLIVKCIDCP